MFNDFSGSIIQNSSTFEIILSAIGTAALVATLYYVIKYTKVTFKMAEETRKLAELQNEELVLKKQPIISFYNIDRSNFLFRNNIRNYSNVHAFVRIKAEFTFINHDGDEVVLTPIDGNHYDGKKIMEFQAGYGIDGHLDMERVIKKKSDFDDVVEARGYEWKIEIRISAINYHEYKGESEFDKKKNQNPTLRYNWSPNQEVWIPEVMSR